MSLARNLLDSCTSQNRHKPLGFIGRGNQTGTGRRVVDCVMGTKPQSQGLLSKVASIFRAPNGGASGSGTHDAAESQHSIVGEAEKNALQALIQRKRQDDLVRRREFNYLRKLRKSPHGTRATGVDGGERVSSFPNSSGFTVDDRASTLRKIDAIEAHMISSWARSKVAAVVPAVDARSHAPAVPASAPVFDYVPTQPAPLRSEVPSPAASRTPPPEDSSATAELDNLDLDFTGLMSTPGSAEVDTWDAPVPDSAPTMQRRSDPPVLQDLAPPVGIDFPTLTSAQQAAPMAEASRASVEPLPEHIESALQDAAIHFAEGGSASAEAVLLGLLQADDISTRTADVVASALFDLYRASGQQDGFDVVAMDYAERFGRSPGEWFSLPEMLQGRSETAVAAPVTAKFAMGQSKAWESPKVLSASALVALRAQFSAPQAAWHVDWIALADIEPEAAPTLADLMAFWTNQPVELHWSGVESLLRALELYTPADDNTVDALWWRLRLDALCILQRHDDFESLALDYCVVYEVSPPSWRPAACTFIQDQSSSTFGGLTEGPSSVSADDLPVLSGPFAACELVGEVCGEATQAMAKLVAAGESADHVVVSCALTVRMDFPAAGTVLNWVIECESRGCQVQFVLVPRLVAVFFQMLGIDRYAKIAVRAN